MADDCMKTLLRRAAKDRVEVEYLVTLAATRDPSLAPRLRALKEQHGWTETGFIPGTTNRHVPLGRWSDYVCAYLESGPGRLVELALSRSEATRSRVDGLVPCGFALGVLQGVKSAGSVRAVVTIGRGLLADPTLDPGPGESSALGECVASLNLLLSFGQPEGLESEDRDDARIFLQGLLDRDWAPVHVATTFLALRSVGDASTLAILAARPPLPEPWAKVPRLASKAIRSRL